MEAPLEGEDILALVCEQGLVGVMILAGVSREEGMVEVHLERRWGRGQRLEQAGLEAHGGLEVGHFSDLEAMMEASAQRGLGFRELARPVRAFQMNWRLHKHRMVCELQFFRRRFVALAARSLVLKWRVGARSLREAPRMQAHLRRVLS